MRFIFYCTFSYRTFIIIICTSLVIVYRQIIAERRSYRFCENINYRNLTFSVHGFNLYNHTRSMCASSCAGLIQCTWFSYNIDFGKCTIFNISTLQHVGSGIMERGTKHYVVRTGKNVYYCLSEFFLCLLIKLNY